MPVDRERLRAALALCAVTDRHWIARDSPDDVPARTLEGQVADAIAGGATMIQIREKGLPPGEFAKLARRAREVTERAGVPLVVNDSLEVALASGADGIHVGQDDGDPAAIRAAIGAEAILGVSAHSVAEAIAAERAGADYIGIGAVFPTGTKDCVPVIKRDLIRSIAASVSIPSIAIGGITASNAKELEGLGLSGVAAISAVFSDPARVTERTRALAREARAVVAGTAEGKPR